MQEQLVDITQSIRFANGCKIAPVIADGLFLGLGSVSVGGVALRHSRRPMFVEIRNPDGIELSDYSIAKQSISPTAATFEFAMKRRQSGMTERMLHEVRYRYAATDWTATPEDATDTRLRLKLRPVVRQIGEYEAIGFSYQYHYTSPSIQLYKLLDRSTWEIGGDAHGNEIWMRNGWSQPIVPIKQTEQHFSTEWHQPNIKYPDIFQFVPLQTQLQGFTFTASAAGVLITWATQASHIRTLVEKPRGYDEIVHLHEHCQDLSGELTTSPMEVLFIPGQFDWVQRANLYWSMQELVADTLHQQLGLRRERVCTYGVIEEWVIPDFDRYRLNALPKLLGAGIQSIYLANHFANNMNVYGVSNFCCPLDLRVPASVGPEKLREFCHAAKAGGAMVEMWGNTALSTLAIMLRSKDAPAGHPAAEPTAMDELSKAADPFVRNPSGAIEADHYTPMFAVMNLRDPTVRNFWSTRWQEAYDNLGLGGVFLDSSFNLSSDKFHYIGNPQANIDNVTPDQSHLFGFIRPAEPQPGAILSQYMAYLELIAEMQKMGYRYCAEDLGVFGLHRHGPDVTWRVKSLPMWNESLANFDPAALRKAGDSPDDIFFRGLAYRMMWSIFWHAESDQLSFNYYGPANVEDRPTQWHIDLLKAFNVVNASMVRRAILPDEVAVRYDNGNSQVFWCFKPLELPLQREMVVHDVLQGTRILTSQLIAKPLHVYLIEPEIVDLEQ